jgi:hypothetical protein
MRFLLDGIRTVGMEKEDLTLFDVLYIGWLRKAISFGKDITIQAPSMCPQCGEENVSTFLLKDLDFTDTEIESLPVIAPLAEKELNFKFLTVRDHIELIKDNLNEDAVSFLAKSVSNMNFDEAYNTLYNITGDDVDTLQEVNKFLYHGVKPISCTCTECEYTYEVSITSPETLIAPFRSVEGSNRSKIRFGS